MSAPKIGWFCTYTPIEILEAAKLEPYGIRVDSGKGHEDAYLGDSMCSYVRSCLGGALAGDYDFLDGVVIAHSCECMRRLYDGWVFRKADIKPRFLHLLDVPRTKTPASVNFFAREIERFKQSVEAVYGPISEASLLNAVEESARTSKLLSRLNRTRKRDDPPVRGAQVQEIMIKGITTRRSAFNAELETMLENPMPGKGSYGKPRILVYGGPADSRLIAEIEEAGGIVVCEHMCNGLRQVRNTDSTAGDPFTALAENYLSKSPCPRMIGSQGIFGLTEIKKLVRDFHIDGIVYFSMKFCANAQLGWPLFKEVLGGLLPVKMLEGDISEDMNVREVQSFVRKLERKGKQNGTGTEG